MTPTKRHLQPAGSPESTAVMTEHLGVPDLAGVEARLALITATGERPVDRRPLGDGSLWGSIPAPQRVA